MSNIESREPSTEIGSVTSGQVPSSWAIHSRFPDRIVHGGHENRPVGASIYDRDNRDRYANVVALVCPDQFGTGKEVNARLIAAAPDLLEALKLAEDVLSRSPYSTGLWPNGKHPNAGVTQIRAAIAKATGQAPSSAKPDADDRSGMNTNPNQDQPS